MTAITTKMWTTKNVFINDILSNLFSFLFRSGLGLLAGGPILGGVGLTQTKHKCLQQRWKGNTAMLNSPVFLQAAKEVVA